MFCLPSWLIGSFSCCMLFFIVSARKLFFFPIFNAQVKCTLSQKPSLTASFFLTTCVYLCHSVLYWLYCIVLDSECLRMNNVILFSLPLMYLIHFRLLSKCLLTNTLKNEYKCEKFVIGTQSSNWHNSFTN